MRKGMGVIFAIAVLAVMGGGSVRAQKQPKAQAPACPMMVEGARVLVANLSDGVTIRITAKDPAVVKRIQAAASEMARRAEAASPAPAGQAVYACPMGDYEGPRTPDGRCPKCGMDLKRR
jgi:TusA-related sulfurtransferase